MANNVSIVAQLRGNLLTQLQGIQAALTAVKVGLTAVSAAATPAGAGLGTMANNAVISITKVRNALSALGTTIGKNFFGGLKSAFTDLNKGFSSVLGNIFSLKNAFLGLGAALGINALVKNIKDTADYFFNVVETSKRLGLTVEYFSGLAFGVSQVGIGFDALATSLKLLEANLGKNFRNATIEIRNVLEGIGFDFAAAAERGDDFQSQLGTIVDLLNRVSSPSIKSDAYRQLFGEVGPKLLGLFSKGSAGIEEFNRQAQLLNVSLDQGTGEVVTRLVSAFARLSASFEGIKLSILKEVGPAFEFLIVKLTAAIALVPKLSGAIARTFTNAFGAFSPEQTSLLSTEELANLQAESIKNIQRLIGAVTNFITVAIREAIASLFDLALIALQAGFEFIKPSIIALGKDLVFTLFNFEAGGVNIAEKLGLKLSESTAQSEKAFEVTKDIIQLRRRKAESAAALNNGPPTAAESDIAKILDDVLAARLAELDQLEQEKIKANKDARDVLNFRFTSLAEKTKKSAEDTVNAVSSAFEEVVRSLERVLPSTRADFEERELGTSAASARTDLVPYPTTGGSVIYLTYAQAAAQTLRDKLILSQKTEARLKIEEREAREFETRRERAIGQDAEADLEAKLRVNEEVLTSLEAQLKVQKESRTGDQIDLDVLTRKLARTKEIQSFEIALQRVKIIRARAEEQKALDQGRFGVAESANNLAFKGADGRLQSQRDQATLNRNQFVKALEDFNAEQQKQLDILAEKGLQSSTIYDQTRLRIEETTAAINDLNQASLEASETIGPAFSRSFVDFLKNAEDAQNAAKELGNVIAQGLTSGISDALFSIIDGTKSIAEAFRSLALGILEQIFKIVTNALLAKVVLAAIGGIGGVAAGTADGGAFAAAGAGGPRAGFATGGLIPGRRTPYDSVPINARPGEFITNPEATSFYTPNVMMAINKRLIPREPLMALAAGGQPNFGGISSPAQPQSGSSSSTVVHPVLVADGKTMDRILAGGKNEFFTFMADNRDRIKAIIS